MTFQLYSSSRCSLLGDCILAAHLCSCHIAPSSPAAGGSRNAGPVWCLKRQHRYPETSKQVGDGDCGATFKHGGDAVLAAINDIDFEHPAAACSALAAVAARSMGGTSGALYQIFFTAASGYFRKLRDEEEVNEVHYCSAGEAGLAAIQKHGGARQGDRSMVDALLPAMTAATAAACSEGALPSCAERRLHQLVHMCTLDLIYCLGIGMATNLCIKATEMRR
jgi:hypothetical protein